MFSDSFVPLHAGSWLMSIFAGLGAVPSNLTVPFTVAAVAGSIGVAAGDRKSTRLNSSHLVISYAVFCLKKKNTRPVKTVAIIPCYRSESPPEVDLKPRQH